MTTEMDSEPAEVPVDSFWAYRERYHAKLLGSLKRWAVAETVLDDQQYIFFPGEIADRINERESQLERDNSKISGNHGWDYIDVLGLLGRLTERMWHDRRGLRFAIPHIRGWLNSQGRIPSRPPQKADFHPGGQPYDDRLERHTRIARRIVSYAGKQAETYYKDGLVSDAPPGLALRGLLLAQIAEHCSVLEGERIESLQLTTEASEDETGKAGDVRHLSMYIRVEADELEVTDEDELENMLRLFTQLLARLLAYSGAGNQTESFEDMEQVTWQQAIVNSTPDIEGFPDYPTVGISESEGVIDIEYEIRNIRR